MLQDTALSKGHVSLAASGYQRGFKHITSIPFSSRMADFLLSLFMSCKKGNKTVTQLLIIKKIVANKQGD